MTSSGDEVGGCYVCGGPTTGVAVNLDFGLPVLRCRACGLLQTLAPSKQFLQSYYRKSYSTVRQRQFSDAQAAFAARRGEDQRAFIEDAAGPLKARSVLDFGAGVGGALRAFPEAARFAWDPDPAVQDHLLEQDGVTVLQDGFLEGDQHKKFDLVILSHVLEHLRDPLKVLSDIRENLADDGLVFVEVPYEDLSVLKLMARNAKSDAGHLFHFDAITLERLLKEATGYEVLRVSQVGSSAEAFYEGGTMDFDDRPSSDGVWLRAVLQARVPFEPAKPRERAVVDDEVAEATFAARSMALQQLRDGRRAYDLLADAIEERVPASKQALVLHDSGLRRLILVAEKAVAELKRLKSEDKVAAAAGLLKDHAQVWERTVERLETQIIEGLAERDRLRGELSESTVSHGKKVAALEAAKADALLDLRGKHETTLADRDARLEEVKKDLADARREVDNLRTELATARQTQEDADKELAERAEVSDRRFRRVKSMESIVETTLEGLGHRVSNISAEDSGALRARASEAIASNDRAFGNLNESFMQAARQAEDLRGEVARLEADKQRALNADHRVVAAAKQYVAQLEEDLEQSLEATRAVRRSASFKVGKYATWPLRFARNPTHAMQPTAELTFDRMPPLALMEPPTGSSPRHGSASTGEKAEGPKSPAAWRERRDGTSASIEVGQPGFFEATGFDVVRGCFSSADVARFTPMKDRLAGSALEASVIDLANVDELGEDLVFDENVLRAVRGCIGDDVRFLQWSTYQLNHVSLPWHRDSGFRDFGVGADWNESDHPYGVVKIIVYLETANASLALYPASHRTDIDRKKIAQPRKAFAELAPGNDSLDPGRPAPTMVHVRPGDAIVFDQRLLHCGRLVHPRTGRFVKQLAGDKSFVSLTYGLDNPHSSRFYSYFNHERGFDVSPMSEKLVARLKAADLYLATGQRNVFTEEPAKREGIWLPDANEVAA